MTVGDSLTRQGLVHSCAENWAQIERQNLGNYNRGLNDRDGEGFGMSFGVAKPPMQEQPRSACTGLWGLLFWPDRSPAARRGILRGALVKLMLPVVTWVSAATVLMRLARMTVVALPPGANHPVDPRCGAAV